MFRILLPIDFTEGTQRTCLYALTLAATFPEAELRLLHCLHDYLADADKPAKPLTQTTASEAQAEKVIHRNETSAKDQLEDLYRELQQRIAATEGRVSISRVLHQGLAEDGIIAEAKQYKPSLVVMGTKGSTSFGRSFFGTITTKMVQDLRVPVLTVPEGHHGAMLGRVLYATNFDTSDRDAIGQLQQLLQPFSPEIYCLHVSEEDSQQQDWQQLAQLREELQSSTTNQNIHYSILNEDDVADALQQFVHQQGIDLIALTTHKRSTLGSILHPSLAQKLVLHAEVPLLVFHSSEEA